MPQVGIEPTIPVFERAKTVHALDRAPCHRAPVATLHPILHGQNVSSHTIFCHVVPGDVYYFELLDLHF
jgi:hypothetical protein